MTGAPATLDDREPLISSGAARHSWVVDEEKHALVTSLNTQREHVIAETATHAGHLDAARELMDGEQWVVLTR